MSDVATAKFILGLFPASFAGNIMAELPAHFHANGYAEETLAARLAANDCPVSSHTEPQSKEGERAVSATG